MVRAPRWTLAGGSGVESTRSRATSLRLRDGDRIVAGVAAITFFVAMAFVTDMFIGHMEGVYIEEHVRPPKVRGSPASPESSSSRVNR